jgi:hypothetical protein
MTHVHSVGCLKIEFAERTPEGLRLALSAFAGPG